MSPLLGLAAASKRSAIMLGLTLLFSILRDFRLEFWSRAEQRVCTAKSLSWKYERHQLTLDSGFSSVHLDIEDCSEELLAPAILYH